MRIRKAYTVHISFDGDYYSSVEGSYIFTTLEEVIPIVQQALVDLKNAYAEKYNRKIELNIDGYIFHIEDVIASKELLEDYIKYSYDNYFGNWYIETNIIE